jgi:hypothetical protein
MYGVDELPITSEKFAFSSTTTMTCPNGAVGEGGGVAMLMLNADEVESPALSFTPILSANDPARVGVPEMVPPGDKLRPVGSWPLRTDQVYGGVPPVACSVAL